MGKQTSAILAFVLACLFHSTLSADFLPDPDGWIRHWIVYGPIGRFGEHDESSPPEFHPITLEPMIFSDFIAEAEGKPGRWTEKNFLPAPGKEIDTAFGTVLPGHILRTEAREGINPNGKPMGIGWVACDCKVNRDSVFDFPSSENDGPGGDFNRDVRHYVSYSYTYVENLTGGPLVVYPSLSGDDPYSLQLLFGHVPAEAGPDFLELLFDGEARLVSTGEAFCGEGLGPPPQETEEGSQDRVETKKAVLEPGMNLFLIKKYETIFWDVFNFRLRSTIPPYPPITEGIRIHLYPDTDRPDPVLFRRMDADGDGSMGIGDAVRILDALFLGGPPLACPDAADVDDDGVVDLGDAVRALGVLYLGMERQPFPRNCCGLDPTEDSLPECAPGSVRC